MFIQPHFTSTLSFSESRPCGNRLERRKGWDIKKSCREPDRFYVFKKGMGVGWGWQGKKSAEQNFMGFFFGFFKDYYVLDTVNHLYTHIQEVHLQNSMRG